MVKLESWYLNTGKESWRKGRREVDRKWKKGVQHKEEGGGDGMTGGGGKS